MKQSFKDAISEASSTILTNSGMGGASVLLSGVQACALMSNLPEIREV